MDKCVYLLYDKHGTVRYVGQGSPSRVKVVAEGGRSKEFLDIARDGGHISVLMRGLTRTQALEEERKLIAEYLEGKHADWNLVNKVKGTKPKEVKYDYLSNFLSVDFASPTFLVWNYVKMKSNGRPLDKNMVGKTAGLIPRDNQYATVTVDRVCYPAHRVVWCLYNKTDLDQDLVINHIDGNPSNNHPCNLEAVSYKENTHKTTVKNPPKSSGVVGVRVTLNHGIKVALAYYSDKNKRQITKAFSFNKYGESLAMTLAANWRRNKMIEEYGGDIAHNHLSETDSAPIYDKFGHLSDEQASMLDSISGFNDHKNCVVVNRRKIFDSMAELESIFKTPSVGYALNDWVRDGYVGSIRHGYLIEKFNKEVHLNASYDAEVTPVESLKVHIRKAIISDVGTVYLSPSDFSIRVKGYHDINTATLIGTQTKRGRTVYGHKHRFGTIDDVNNEIIRRVEEHNKESSVE